MRTEQEKSSSAAAHPDTPMAYFKHELALVESNTIGDGTRIWAFSHILPGARIGRDCNICDHTFIENDVTIGDRVTVKCGVQLWDGITIEDDVFIGPNAAFGNDPFPRSKQYPGRFLRTVVKKGASIGANATVIPGVVIGEGAMIGGGAVVTRDVPPNTIMAGNPAQITGYSGTRASPAVAAIAHLPEPSVAPTLVKGVTLHRLPLVDDVRGLLSFAEVQRQIPIEVKRYFLVFGVSSEEIRGEHAHKTLHQFFICVHGRCHLVADDSVNRQEFVLDSPSLAIHLPPMVWGMQYKYSSDAVLLVLASDFYEAADYIRDYSEFLALSRK
jgi:acetyltransferase-like isoleucine patch superfamily enzyme/dTDP-4-dehydrorhamnose 3,5-epimerase-like enzyme